MWKDKEGSPPFSGCDLAKFYFDVLRKIISESKEEKVPVSGTLV